MSERWSAVINADLIPLLVEASYDYEPTTRFWAKVDKRTAAGDDCWVWTGALSDEGYGNFSIILAGRRHVVRAHRVAWFFHHQASLEADLYLDHFLTPALQCHGRFCVNPSHLEPVPKHINDERSTGATSKVGQRYRRTLVLEARDLRATDSPALAGAA